MTLATDVAPPGGTSTAARDVRVLTARGDFAPPQRVSWADGTFAFGGTPLATDLVPPPGETLWMLPGLVDAHTHVAWQAFTEEERALDTPVEQDAKTVAALEATLRAGFTSIRDAGGYDPTRFTRDATRSVDRPSAPRLQASVHMLTREFVEASGGVLAAADRALDAGARWIKLVGTASVASPPGSGLDPVFTRAEQRAVVARAAESGAGVMLHAWGGAAIDDAIEAGVRSIEHGIFLTPVQAARAAERGMTLVPTLRIYRLVAEMIERGDLPRAFGPRVTEAVAAHPNAVRHARDAGLAIALGSDFGTTAQHGTNRTEFDALVGAGLTPDEALLAATRGGADLLASVAGGAAPSGQIAPGEIADAVLLTRDPRTPGVLSAPESLHAVILGGELVPHISHQHIPHQHISHQNIRKDTP